MTTAHRPTWHAAVGQKNEGGWQAGGQISQQFSARDLPGHTKLKMRQIGQGTANEVELRDLQSELEGKETKYEQDKNIRTDTAQDKLRRLEQNKKILLLGDAEADAREKELKQVASKYDDDDAVTADASDESDSSGSDSDSDDDDDDEEAELMRELEKIKKEREEERLRKEEEERQQAERASREDALQGNPLMQGHQAGTAKMKRRWNDDVVFKNQSRNEPELKKRFINDTIRNDFHRRFLNKYIQ